MYLLREVVRGLSFAACLSAMTAHAQNCPVTGSQVQPRLSIPVFEYAGAGSGEAKEHFDRFRALVGAKIKTLAEEAAGGTSASSQLRFLDALGLFLPQGRPIRDTLTNVADRRNYWDKTTSLQLMRGTVWPGSPYYVESDIYLGGLQGAFQTSEIRVRLPVLPEEVPTTIDSHSAVTYFALAMETRRLNCDLSISRQLLSRALSIMRDINRRSGGLTGHLRDLEQTVQQELTR